MAVPPGADFYAASILDVDFGALASAGVRGVLLDVDNTLVRPRGRRMTRAVAEHLRAQRESAGISRWALASNSRRDLSMIATAIDAEIVRAGWFCAKPRRAFYRRAIATLGLRPDEVAMVGDKVLHDVSPAARLGLRTVLVQPQWPDQLVDQLLLRRRREATQPWPTKRYAPRLAVATDERLT